MTSEGAPSAAVSSTAAGPSGGAPQLQALLTKWTAAHPVTKRLRLLENNAIEKVSMAAHLYEGRVTVVSVTPQSLVQELSVVEPNDCFSYGIPKDVARKRVLSQLSFNRQGQPADSLPRTTDHMMYPVDGALMMLDSDPRDGEIPLTREDLLKELYLVCPALKSAAHVATVSASSCLYDEITGGEVAGVRGQRILVFVANGSDIPRAGAVLFKRLWLAKHGYVKISSAGSMLLRTLIDQSVFQPNRIDYCAPPICEPPLVSRKPLPIVHGNPSAALDTRTALPDLTEDEQRQFESLVTAAKRAVKDEAERIRGEYREKRVDEFVARGVDREAAQRAVDKALDGGVLLSDFILTTEDGQAVTVGEVLANAGKFHMTRFCDPIEPEYHNDHRIARAYLVGTTRPHIHSFAHGGARYYLARQQAVIRLVPGQRATYLDEMASHLADIGTLFRRGPAVVAIEEVE